MTSGVASNGSNDLLAALPPRELESILAQCERVPLVPDEVLSEPGERIRHGYFVLDGIVALLVEVDQHDALAVGLVGSEGMLGVPLALGVHTSPLRARVQVAGSALRIKAADFQRVLLEMPILERLLRRYLCSRLAQLATTAACASFHVVEMRLAYWLLMAHDRAHGDRFYLTHDRLGRLLGVRRSGVSTAAGVLHARKLINYTRGHITVLDRRGLEEAACSCYRATGEATRPAAVTTRRRDFAGPGSRLVPRLPLEAPSSVEPAPEPGAWGGAAPPVAEAGSASLIKEQQAKREAGAAGFPTTPLLETPASRSQGTRSRS